MSGHSKWHTIKHKKGAADAKRGKLFTRIIKELTIAARNGGGDADTNPRLRTIIADAKGVNMPADNIKRAIRRGTGEEPGVSYEEAQYEGYGPGGTAVIMDVLTDQREKVVVGVGAVGQVREFQLRVRFRFRLRTPQGRELIDETELLLQRDLSFNETAVLAREQEEDLLYRDMQSDIVQQVLRRLAAVRLG